MEGCSSREELEDLESSRIYIHIIIYYIYYIYYIYIMWRGAPHEKNLKTLSSRPSLNSLPCVCVCVCVCVRVRALACARV